MGYYLHLPHILISWLHYTIIWFLSAYESIWLHICLPFTLWFHFYISVLFSSEFYGVFISNHLSHMAYRLFLFFGCSSSLTEDAGIVLRLYFLRVFYSCCAYLMLIFKQVDALAFIHRGCNELQRPWASYREDHVPTLVLPTYILIPFFSFILFHYY